MKLSLNWIKEYVTIPDDMDLSRLAHDLTMTTVEVEGTVELARQFDDVVVGIIEEILPHPNADKLKLCRVDMGEETRCDIVCGGVNLRPGMKAAVARPGAKVRWHGTGEPIEIKETDVRGVKSSGMICAPSEIGLFDLFPLSDEAAVLDLSAFEAEAGTPIAKALGLDDVILEIDNKSITNRPDLWGHYGIAREISALYELPFTQFEPYTFPGKLDFNVEIEDIQGCPRYIGVRMDGISAGPSPFEVQSRIWRVGMRPINALVDITNYVMLATGQPAHAFDSDKIKGDIAVRRARSGEKLLLLNGRELTLSQEDLVISDDARAIGLAGVMGGAADSVSGTTRRVVLEIANFEAAGIRRTASRYEMRTESAVRYEKAIDPERCAVALSLAMSLFQTLYPEMTVTGFCDKNPNPSVPSEIDVSLDWLERRLGKRISEKEIKGKLSRLGFSLQFNGDSMRVTAPTWRSTGDISIREDIMEEVARAHGYESFEPTPITISFDGAINQIEIELERKIKEYLAFRCGMHEIFTYPWMSDGYVDAVLQNTDEMLSLAAPPAPDERYIRSSLLPNLCKAVADNQRYYSEFSIFESAQISRNRGHETPYDPSESLPLQRKSLAGAFVGTPDNTDGLFRRAKGALESMSRYVHMESLTFQKKERPVWADHTVWLNVCLCEEPIGNLALLSKKASLDCGIKNSAAVLFELDIDALKPHPSRNNQFTRLPEYPMTDYDLSLLFDLAVKWEEILAVIFAEKERDDLIRHVYFVDQYMGTQVPEGKKSITIRLVVGSLQKTITSSDIENSVGHIVKQLEKKLNAKIRS